MIQKFNLFLNIFEAFVKRVLTAVFLLVAIPFVVICYIFGFFDFSVDRKNEDE